MELVEHVIFLFGQRFNMLRFRMPHLVQQLHGPARPIQCLHNALGDRRALSAWFKVSSVWQEYFSLLSFCVCPASWLILVANTLFRDEFA